MVRIRVYVRILGPGLLARVLELEAWAWLVGYDMSGLLNRGAGPKSMVPIVCTRS